jgi:hypothetical protein
MSVVSAILLSSTPNESRKMTIVKKLEEYVSRATPGQIEQATKWYLEAEKVAVKVAENLGTPSLEIGASVVSAFSPRERWVSNVAKALQWSNGKSVTGLPNNLKMAEASKVLGFEALKGPKTNAFARAIAGDESAVVVDVWMMRAAAMPTDSPNKKQYDDVATAVTEVSVKYGLTPRTAQALIWIIVRGSAE